MDNIDPYVVQMRKIFKRYLLIAFLVIISTPFILKLLGYPVHLEEGLKSLIVDLFGKRTFLHIL